MNIKLIPCDCLKEDEAWLLSVVEDKLQAVKITNIGGQDGRSSLRVEEA
jgi:hypothetical protein